MRRIVGESSTTRILFVLSLSDTSEDTLHLGYGQVVGEHYGKPGLVNFGGTLLYGKVWIYKSENYLRGVTLRPGESEPKNRANNEESGHKTERFAQAHLSIN